jgi:hypothetical protein
VITTSTPSSSSATLARLNILAEKEMHRTGTRDDKMFQIIWAAEENAGDSGLKDSDEGWTDFVLDSMRDLLSDRNHLEESTWYASHGFIA